MDKITALGQCHSASSRSTSNFENLLSRRNRQLVDPSQHYVQPLSINRSLDSLLFVNISPLRDAGVKVCVDESVWCCGTRELRRNSG